MMKIHIILLLISISFFTYAQEADVPSEELATQAQVNPYDLFREGKYTEAIEVSQKQIAINKNNILPYVVMGWAYINTRQWKNALDISTRAERIAPNDVRILETKGEAYYQLREDEKALDYFSRYLSLSPKGSFRGWVYYYVGVIYLRQGKLNKADISFSTALSLERDRVQWWLNLGSVYEQQEKKDLAKEVYRTVLSINSNNATARRKLQQLNQE